MYKPEQTGEARVSESLPSRADAGAASADENSLFHVLLRCFQQLSSQSWCAGPVLISAAEAPLLGECQPGERSVPPL